MRTLASVSVVVFLNLGGAQAGDDALRKKELEALRGTWSVLTPVNDQDVKTRFSMVEDSLQINMGGATIDFTLTINPAKKPKEITITTRLADGSDKSMLGIYKLEGDTLKLCFGEKRPTEFKAGSMYELKREKKKGK